MAAPVAGAHAVFQSSDPAPDSTIPTGAATITVVVTEDVNAEYSTLEVADLNGTSVAAGATEFPQPNTYLVRTRALDDGIYVVTWKALSADTHTTRGSFLLAAGNATLRYASGAIDETPQDAGGGPRDGVARAAFYAGLMVALGLPLFFLLVDRERDPPRAALVAGTAFALVGSAGAVVNLQGLAERTAVPLLTLATTSAGVYLAGRAGFLALAGIGLLLMTLLPPARRSGPAGAAVVFALAALVATSLGSHAASVSTSRGLSIGMDMVHLLVAAVWLGGVAGFLFALPSATSEHAARMVTRFSPLAMGSVAVILATGVYAGLRFIPSLDDLWTEPYGRLVALKALLLLPLIGLGAYNQRVARPKLKAGATPRLLRRAVAVEAGVMALVLLAAGVLATTSPPQAGPDLATRTPLIFEAENRTDVTHVVLQVTPNPVVIGVQTLTVYLHPLTPDPVPNSTIVQLKIWHENETAPDVTIEPEKTGIGEWTTRGGHFTQAGKWNVQVLYQRPDEGFRKFTFQVPVQNPAQPGGTTP